MILNVSNKHVCLNKLCMVSKPFFLNRGFVCCFSYKSLPNFCLSLVRAVAQVLNFSKYASRLPKSILTNFF